MKRRCRLDTDLTRDRAFEETLDLLDRNPVDDRPEEPLDDQFLGFGIGHPTCLQVKNMLLRGRVGEAIDLAKNTPGPIAKITAAGLAKHNRPRDEIKDAIEAAAHSEVYLLEKNLGVLGTVAAIAPLIGFLGTVTGMIRAFMQVQNLGGSVDASVLAGGIWEALITTAAGIIIAVPAVVLYNYFVRKISVIVQALSIVRDEIITELKIARGAHVRGKS